MKTCWVRLPAFLPPFCLNFRTFCFGPLPPLVSRVKGLYLQKIIIKIKPEISLKAAKDYLCQARDQYMKDKVCRQVQLYFDVDPV